MKVVLIGAGNVATHLSLAIQKTDSSIVHIYSRSENSAQTLGKRLQTNWTTNLKDITQDADLYIFALKDDILPEIVRQMQVNKGLWVHTAGSVSMDVFKGYTERYGVLYPLQTFSKDRDVDFNQLPCFIEANSQTDESILLKITGLFSNRVQTLSSEKRKHLHLAAVFACNFTNHMYVLAGKLLEEQQIPSDVLLPLIDETVAKVHMLTPVKAQTGPAIRYDQQVINQHLGMLNNPVMKEIYQLISQNIHKEASHE